MTVSSKTSVEQTLYFSLALFDCNWCSCQWTGNCVFLLPAKTTSLRLSSVHNLTSNQSLFSLSTPFPCKHCGVGVFHIYIWLLVFVRESLFAHLMWFSIIILVGDRSYGSQPGSARSSLSSLSDSVPNISYSSEVRDVCTLFCHAV